MSGKKLDKLRHAEVTSEENGCCYFLDEFKNDKISDILYCYIVLLYTLLYFFGYNTNWEYEQIR